MENDFISGIDRRSRDIYWDAQKRYLLLLNNIVFALNGLNKSGYQVISRYVGLSDLDIPREKWLNYLQTVETQIRCLILQCLI